VKKIMLILSVICLACAVTAYAEEEVLFGFENGLEGWDVPDWAYEKPDHVQKEIKTSNQISSEGNGSLEMVVDFPGTNWAGGIVEIVQFFDWSDYGALACDIYLPAEGPTGLKAKIILTVGNEWNWVEMSRDFELIPGEWITVKADLLPGSLDWRKVQVDEAFRQDIRKMDVRIVSKSEPGYSGSIFIDNVRVIK